MAPSIVLPFELQNKTFQLANASVQLKIDWRAEPKVDWVVKKSISHFNTW